MNLFPTKRQARDRPKLSLRKVWKLVRPSIWFMPKAFALDKSFISIVNNKMLQQCLEGLKSLSNQLILFTLTRYHRRSHMHKLSSFLPIRCKLSVSTTVRPSRAAKGYAVLAGKPPAPPRQPVAVKQGGPPPKRQRLDEAGARTAAPVEQAEQVQVCAEDQAAALQVCFRL